MKISNKFFMFIIDNNLRDFNGNTYNDDKDNHDIERLISFILDYAKKNLNELQKDGECRIFDIDDTIYNVFDLKGKYDSIKIKRKNSPVFYMNLSATNVGFNCTYWH